MKYLLDNDVFLAAIYAGHEYHRTARKWLDASKASGWGIATETYLAAARLLMNPAVMGSGALPAETALLAIQIELHGPHPGGVALAPRLPDPLLLGSAAGIARSWTSGSSRSRAISARDLPPGTPAAWQTGRRTPLP